MFYKSKFTNSDNEEVVEGYTDGTLYNGWANVYFTREQLCAAVGAYGIRFIKPNTRHNRRDYPVAIVYFEDELLIESSPIGIENENGELCYIEAYTLDGFEFIEVDKN